MTIMTQSHNDAALAELRAENAALTEMVAQLERERDEALDVATATHAMLTDVLTRIPQRSPL
jgi:hypothetical protein